jgi:hypothetical protein|tara:strand:+ start:396 stop:719 length:324 start_codon:yes stop_codon:yes gene_type:complete
MSDTTSLLYNQLSSDEDAGNSEVIMLAQMNQRDWFSPRNFKINMEDAGVLILPRYFRDGCATRLLAHTKSDKKRGFHERRIDFEVWSFGTFEIKRALDTSSRLCLRI